MLTAAVAPPFQLRLLRPAKRGTFGLLVNQSLGSTLAEGGSPPELVEWPIVWGSLSGASAAAEAVQPWASSQAACHRSLSLGVVARIVRLCRSLTFISHC